MNWINVPLLLAQEDLQPAGAGGANTTANSAANAGAENGTIVTTGENDQPLGGPQAQPAAPPGLGGSTFFLVMIGMLGLMIFISMRGQSKERKKRQELIASLKKGNRVQTIGGIIGTVVEVRDNEVVLKVDENGNTRIKFAKSAIQNVTDEAAGE